MIFGQNLKSIKDTSMCRKVHILTASEGIPNYFPASLTERWKAKPVRSSSAEGFLHIWFNIAQWQGAKGLKGKSFFIARLLGEIIQIFLTL